MKINPFRPNTPINPGMFVGRIPEIKKLERSLLQTKNESPVNIIITGERGIGKTSLLDYFRYISTGKISVEEIAFNYLVIETDISKTTTRLDLIRKIEIAFRDSLSKTEKAREFFSKTWEFLQRIEAGGVKISQTDKCDSQEIIFEEFSNSFCETIMRICNNEDEMFTHKYDGVVLIIDEADNCSDELALGGFFKLLTERLHRKDCNKLMICMAGLLDLKNKLLEGHKSSLRLFEEISLTRLSIEEVSRVIKICIDDSNEMNKEHTSITTDAIDFLVSLSEGYPHFIQQFGFCAFNADLDNVIDINDVKNGAWIKGGAWDLIGDSYYRNDFYNKIQKDNYRQVLSIMAEKLDSWVTKKEIRQKFNGKESILTNAIKALLDRDIILAREGVKGSYRLRLKGFAVWIKIEEAKTE